MADLHEQKSALRKQVLAKRDSLPPEFRIKASLSAAEHGLEAQAFSNEHFIGGTVVSGFLPIRSEIDTRPLMAALASRGATLCLPVVLDKTTIEFRELIRTAPLVDTGFGTVGPAEDATVLDPQIMIVPLTAFDRLGGRMGYGAGHYDRAIGRLISKGVEPVLLGMAFSAQEVETVPMEDHDKLLHGIITETGLTEATG